MLKEGNTAKFDCNIFDLYNINVDWKWFYGRKHTVEDEEYDNSFLFKRVSIIKYLFLN